MPVPQSAVKFDLFAHDARKRKIETLGNPLPIIARPIDFAHLAGLLDELYPRPDAAKGARPPYPTEVMVRVLILKRLYNLSDEQLEYQRLDHRRIAKIRAPVEHPLAQIAQMGGKLIRTIGQARATAAMTRIAACYNLKRLVMFLHTGADAFYKARPSKSEERLQMAMA